MGRPLLNWLPELPLFAVFVAAAVLLAVGGVVLLWSFLPAWRDESSSQVVLGVSAIVMTLFALLLALVVVDLDSSYNDASKNVSAEANSLSNIEQDADAFPDANKASVEKAVADYIVQVHDHEFPALRDGHEDDTAEQKLLLISTALQAYTPETQTQITFYDSAVSQVDNLVSERHSRVAAAESSVPIPLAVLLLALAVMSIGTSLFVKTHDPRLDLLLVLSIAAVVGLALATTLILEYPFSGSVAVSSDPLVHGPLAQLVRQYR
jgi:Protein of unknown function (DUF4239)